MSEDYEGMDSKYPPQQMMLWPLQAKRKHYRMLIKSPRVPGESLLFLVRFRRRLPRRRGSANTCQLFGQTPEAKF